MGADHTAEQPATKRVLDPERTRQDILAVASEEFAERGLNGARMDAIAARTRTAKRMIYYYFGSKENLYLRVLEDAYGSIRAAEKDLHLDQLAPADAIRRLVEFTFDYEDAHPEFIRLVCIENIHRGRYIAQSETIRNLNIPVVEALTGILERGKRDGTFHAGADAVDVHMLISAFCFFHVSNRHTFGALFQRDFSDPALRAAHRRMITETVLRSIEARTQA